jgi:hypothetical protein
MAATTISSLESKPANSFVVSTVIDRDVDMHTAQQLVVAPLRSAQLTHVVNEAVVPPKKMTGTGTPDPQGLTPEDCAPQMRPD